MSAPPPRTASPKKLLKAMPGEAAWAPGHQQKSNGGQRVKMINLESGSRSSKGRDIKPNDDYMPEAQKKAMQRTTETLKRMKEADGSAVEREHEIPYGQVRSMFQGRLQSLILQNRTQCRKLFRKWDPDNKGFVTAARFNGLLKDFGVDVSREESDSFIAKFVDVPTRVTFDELFFKIMGLPHDFFSMNFTDGEAIVDDAGSRSQVRPPLPKGTSFQSAEKIFKTRMRKILFNVEASINNVFERAQNGKTKIDRDEFWTMLNARGLMVTPAELDELMSHFDQNCDGLVDLYELAHEMLRLPKPHSVRHITTWHEGRPAMGNRCKVIVKQLRELCEKASAPPAALYNLFTRYDADGSGKIAYDEIAEMVRDTGTMIEGRDVCSEFLDKYSAGKNEISYQDFIVSVLGLRPDALKSKANTLAPRCPTAEVVEKVGIGIKRHLQGEQTAIDRVFSTFDKDHAGEMRFAEFVDGVKSMGLPISRAQMKKMFKEFDKDVSGCLDVHEFARDVMGIQNHHVPGQTPSSRPPPTPIGSVPMYPTSPPMRTGAVSVLGSQRHSPSFQGTPLSRPKSSALQPFSKTPGSSRDSPQTRRSTSRSLNLVPPRTAGSSFSLSKMRV